MQSEDSQSLGKADLVKAELDHRPDGTVQHLLSGIANITICNKTND